jgi:hypothetical protein
MTLDRPAGRKRARVLVDNQQTSHYKWKETIKYKQKYHQNGHAKLLALSLLDYNQLFIILVGINLFHTFTLNWLNLLLSFIAAEH